MKMKTTELTGPALDWAVAKCNGVPVEAEGYVWSIGHVAHQYSSDWSLAGPIIEEEGIRWNKKDGMYYSWTPDHAHFDPLHEPFIEGEPGIKWWGFAWGETLLVAAMRCYVRGKLGDEVDIPEELA